MTVLQRIQDTFARAIGFAAMMVSKTGAPITRASNFQPLCHLIRSTPQGMARCSQCDAAGGFQAHASGCPYSYMCAGGLLDIAAPIVIEGEYLGSVFCGQVIPLESQAEFTEEIIRRNEFLGLPQVELSKIVQEIPILPRERIDAAAEMLQLMANYVVEMGLTNLTQAKLLKEAREKAALQATLQTAQLRALQGQVNPHFLFNALALVSYTAAREKAPQTEEIVHCLSDLLRYSLRNIATRVTLAQELEIVEHYLTLQKLRFGEQLRTEFKLEPELCQASIPCMILQPLVENAVIHGVEPLTRPVTVRIQGFHWLKGIMLEISDDGAGIPAAIAEAVNTRTFTYNEGSSRLGLQNVIRRLEGEYGDRFAFHLEGEPEGGTRVAMFLPLNR